MGCGNNPGRFDPAAAHIVVVLFRATPQMHACVHVHVQYHHEFVPIEGLKTTMRVIVNGTGDRTVGVGDVVTVHAKGIQKHFGNSPGHIFYSTKERQQGGPFTYKVGSNRLPIGWDVGCRGMRLGEKREFDIPWQEVRVSLVSSFARRPAPHLPTPTTRAHTRTRTPPLHRVPTLPVAPTAMVKSVIVPPKIGVNAAVESCNSIVTESLI